MFFVAGSKITKFRSERKRLLEEDYKEGGQRDWLQVLCTAGPASVMSVVYLFECGAGEHHLDLRHHTHASLITIAVLGSLSCAAGDTFSSEVGTVVGAGDPLLITTFRRVPRGTNGGVSLWGTVASGVGGALVGAAHYLTLVVVMHHPAPPPSSPPQSSLVLLGALGGVLGTIC
ncbi:transmembrane protein 19 [Hyalella azteca]|uniref:Transmembrane protein 19 n=1 Tax=Hyalella azteca TaxID=294128 RepID=A0A8B7NK19_HYAAZ|nr:transmembrane protein 19 [Hyalella azteca]